MVVGSGRCVRWAPLFITVSEAAARGMLGLGVGLINAWVVFDSGR